VSTASVYACKEFYKSYRQEKNKQKREQQKNDWLSSISREIRIMMNYPHVSMI